MVTAAASLVPSDVPNACTSLRRNCNNINDNKLEMRFKKSFPGHHLPKFLIDAKEMSDCNRLCRAKRDTTAAWQCSFAWSAPCGAKAPAMSTFGSASQRT